MTATQYKEHANLGSGQLRMLLDNARKFRKVQTGELDITTREMELGRVFHCALLEPEKLKDLTIEAEPLSNTLLDICSRMNTFEKIDVIECTNKNQKIFQEAKKEAEKHERRVVITKEEQEKIDRYLKNKDKVFILKSDLDTIQKWVDKALEIPHFKEIISNSKKEEVFFGEVDGVGIKARIDCLFYHSENEVSVFDPKTMAEECTSHHFARASGDHFYHMQESVYRRVLIQNDLNIREFHFVGVSKKEWSGANYFQHGEKSRYIGDKWVEAAINKYKYCLENNIWLESDFNFNYNKFEIVSTVEIPAYTQNKFPLLELI